MSMKQNKKPTICQIYQVGDFIDAKDNQGDWRVGYIIQKNQITKTFKIRFDGWASKYDQYYKFGHPKLKQFRSIVSGYTGQKQNPAVRQGWKFSLIQHEKKLSQLFSYTLKNNQQHIKTPHLFNQWIRGHNYIYTDFLMTANYSTEQQLVKVLQFFKLNISFVIKYMNSITQNFEQFVACLDRKDNVYLEDLEAAKCFSYYEIFDMMYTITGSYQRLNTFFKQHDELLRQNLKIGSAEKDVKKVYQMKMIEYFLRQKGFDNLNAILKLIDQHKKPLPYSFLYSLAHLYHGVSCVIQPKSKQSTIKQLKRITQKSLQLIQDKQMKDFYHQEILDLIGEIVICSSKCMIEKDIVEWSELVELEVYYKMIMCGFFEKKLKGITSLQEFIEQKLQLIADGTISKWISQKNLFDVLFSNDNPQLIKKSTQLIKFLYNKDNQMQKYIQLLWKYKDGKHQTALKEIYTFMGEVPIYDRNYQFTVQLFKKCLANVGEENWDSDYIKMVKDFTINALFSRATAQNTNSKVTETFGFNIIYEYLQKNQSDLTLLNYLIQILDKLEKTKFLESFIIQCFIKIQKKININFHISLILRILKEKISDIRDLKIDCRAIIQQNIIETKDHSVQASPLSHNMQQQFELLNQILKQIKEIILEQDFIHFWKQMIDSKSRVFFFKWLYKVRDSGKIILTNFINLQTKQYLLKTFWTQPYLQNHPTFDQYQAIFLLQLFKCINNNQQKIKRNNLLIQIVDTNLIGLDKLHLAYEKCTNQKATAILAKGLAEIYMSGGQQLLQLSGVSLVHLFIVKTTNKIINYTKLGNLQGTIKMIRLLDEFLLRDEQIFDINPTIRTFSIKQYLVKNLQNNESCIVKYNIVQIVYNFKKLLSQKFNIPLYKFDILVNQQTGEIIEKHNYFKSLGELDIKGGKLFIKLRNKETSQVKQQLNHHLELLFELLGNKQIQEKIWNIVSKLPLSNQLKVKLIENQNPLKILQNNNSLYKQLYMFKIVLSLDKKWWNRDNLSQVIGFFVQKLNKSFSNTQIQRQYIMVSGRILQKIAQSQQISDRKLFSQLFLSIFQIMKRLLKNTTKIQNINLFYVKRFIQTFCIIGETYNSYLNKNGLKSKEKDSFSMMLEDTKIADFLKLCLIEYRHESLRKQFPVKLLRLANFNKQAGCEKIATLVLTDLLDFTISYENKKNLREYTMFSSFLLQSRSQYLKQFYQQHKSTFFKKLFNLIKSQPSQQNSQTQNLSLNCYCSLIRHVISEVSQQQLSTLFQYIYQQCLFKGNLSKCKTKQTRTTIFSLLYKFIKNRKNQNKILSTFGQLHKNGIWRSRKLEDWVITQNQRLKSSTGYTGLRNLGCICYMNSFFQQIFMIQQFRYSMLLAQDPSYNPNQIADNVFYQVKKMFLNLMYSDKKAYNPKSFCMSFKDYQGNPTNVSQQMDIDQFSGILFDRLENSMKGTKFGSLVKDTFGGVFSNEIICKGCPHFSQSEEHFLSLSLTVKDKRSVYQSLQTMIKGDTLDGDNAYHCERCDKKVSAVKRVCLKSLPDYLIVTLKRFQFDFNTMTKLKVNQYCQFPNQINLEEYSYEYLRKKQNPKAFEGQELKSKKYYEYKLKGVVIHLGYADSGHYYSLIQQRTGEQRWLEFNDTIVRKFNVQNLHDQAFGGQTGGLQSKQKIKNAYMLIYERVQKVHTQKRNQIMRAKHSIKQIQMYKQIFQTIDQQNSEYNVESILFSNEYNKFVNNLIDQAGKNKQVKQEQQMVQIGSMGSCMLDVQKFVLLTFFTVLMRSKTDPGTFETLQKIYLSFGKDNHKLNQWILELFCDTRIYDEFFRNCPLRETKKIIAEWMILVWKQCSNQQIKIRFLKTIVDKITTQNQNTVEPLMIIHNLVANGEQQVRKLCFEYNVVGRLLENIVRKMPRLFGNSVFTAEEPKQIQTNSFSKHELGYQQIIQRSPFQLKKFKYQNDSGIVWALIHQIIHKYSIQNLQKHIFTHQKQFSYLFLSKDKIYKLLQQAKSKFDIEVLTDYLTYLAYDNRQYNEDLILIIEKGIKQFASKKYRQFFILFAKLLNVNDGMHEERLTWIHNVIRSLKENQKYAMDCTIIELWICKLVNENQSLRAYLMSEKKLLGYLSGLPLNKVPSDELSKKNSAFGQNTVSKFHGIPFPASRKGYTKVLKQVQQFYQKLQKQIYQPIQFFQSGSHCVYDKLSIGQKIAYFDIKDKVDYEQAIIKQIFLERLCISRKSQPNKSFWIWQDDQKLTSNLNVIRQDHQNELDSSKTTEMEDEIDFEGVS